LQQSGADALRLEAEACLPLDDPEDVDGVRFVFSERLD
jgi:hypothetical protein